MTTTEFSNEFDLMWDNLRYNNSGYASLNEYEKSVFLTQAQEEIIKNYYNPKGNKYHEGIGDSDKRDMDFSELLTVVQQDSFSTSLSSLDSRIIYFEVASDVFFIINENLKYTYNGKQVNTTIKPLSPIEYDRLSSKVCFEPPKRVSWRLMDKSGEGDIQVQILPHTGATLPIYTVRYVKRPDPIILENIDTYSINGVSTISECELNPIIHREILTRAVVLATASLNNDLNTAIVMDQKSE